MGYKKGSHMKNSLKLTIAALALSLGVLAPVCASHVYYPGYYTAYSTYPGYYQPVVYQQVPVRYERVVHVPVVQPVIVNQYVRPAYVNRPYRNHYRRHRHSHGGFSFSVGF